MDAPHSLGYWVRRRRKALDLTQAELAERVACVVVTIKKIEQDARRPSRLLAERLADALHLSDAERAPFLAAARGVAALERLVVPSEPLAPVTAPTRRVFLFTDIVGSAQLWERYNAAMSLALARYDALIRGALTRHGGVVFKTLGDGFCGAFAAAPDALFAAIDAQQALLSEAWAATGLPPESPPRVRMALHAGLAEQRDGDFFGPPLDQAARLLAAAHGGQVLVSATTAALLRQRLPPGSLLRDLGVHQLKDLAEPDHLFQLVAPGLASDFPPPRAMAALASQVPPAPPVFLGRDAALGTLTARTGAGARLTTVTGPGGSGKTTLAIMAAHKLRESFDDGVWFVDLASLRDPALLADKIAEAIGATVSNGSPLEALRAHLGTRHTLLILDNLEQIAAGAPMLAELLAACPQLVLLATSRVPLRLRLEQEHPLPPLALPPQGADLDVIAASPAVQLFVARASAVRPSFSLDHATAASVAELCRRLDGMPLALELAAARVRILTPAALLQRLSLSLLSGGPADAPERQRTLQATIAWSEALLRRADQQLFAALGAFAGSISLELAAAAAGKPVEAILEGMEELVAHSLVVEAGDVEGEPRFLLLETIRAYAGERLAERGDEPAVHGRLLSFYTAAAAATARASGEEQARKLAWFGREAPNLRLNLGWAVQHAPMRALELLAAMRSFLDTWSRAEETWPWVEAALRQAGPHVPAGLSARALLAMAVTGLNTRGEATRALTAEVQTTARALGDDELLVEAMGILDRWAVDPAEALPRYSEGLAIAERLGDARVAGRLADTISFLHYRRGDLAQTRLFIERAVALSRASGDELSLEQQLINLAELCRMEGDAAHAVVLLDEMVRLARRRGSSRRIAMGLANLGAVELSLGTVEAARTQLSEALLRFRDEPWNPFCLTALEAMAGVQIALGNPERGVRLLGAAEALLEIHSESREGNDQVAYDHHAAASRAALGQEAWTLAFATGRTLSLEAAIALAVQPT